ncbi:MAG: hydantoinase/oxoprolinase family protein [Nitrososphaeraceae archaeon]|jgi:N-methylhydantoinase A
MAAEQVEYLKQKKIGKSEDYSHNIDVPAHANYLSNSYSRKRRIRVGIDVGGTFTKAVAIDMVTGNIIGKSTLPTTHKSNQGVSTGILQVLSDVMNKFEIQNYEVELISHSTTQAVNALLEGDTTKVGIIGMGVGLEKSNIIKRTHIKDILLDGNGKRYIKTCYRYLDTSAYLGEERVRSLINELVHEGARVLVISEAYGVDDPSNEDFVENVARSSITGTEDKKIPVIAAHDLTGIYGLEIRTMTAVINASILPKAASTARFVEHAVREKIGIPKNISIKVMKGDGGVTDISAFETKPIVTVLSGPAASVAGALLHLRILNGVFVEVGGTSTNVCVIKDGKPKVNYATIVQHPTCIRSLDVRVVNVAGGSIVMLSKDRRKILDVGPRSAHIAGLKYSCFAEPSEIEGGTIVRFSPEIEEDSSSKHPTGKYESNSNGDEQRMIYAVIKSGDRYNDSVKEGDLRENLFAITTTCAANALGLISDDDYAKGNSESAKIALSILAKELGISMEEAASQILDIATDKILQIMDPMLKEYALTYNKPKGFLLKRKGNNDRFGNEEGNSTNRNFVLVGGGGGASILVPHLAKTLNMKYKKAEHAEVISSIGVAAAMIHEELERTVDVNPKPEEVSLLMDEVKELALAKGALPESITVQSEYVSDRSVLRVTATGNMSLDIGTANSNEISNREAEDIAKDLFGATSSPNSEGAGDDKIEGNRNVSVRRVAFDAKNYHIFECEKKVKNLFGFIKRSQKTQVSVLVLDRFGRVRLSLAGVRIVKGTKQEVLTDLLRLLGSPISHIKGSDKATNDRGQRSENTKDKRWDLPPQVHLLDDIRLIDFSSLTSSENLSKVIRDEVQKSSSRDVLAVIKK